MRTIAQCARLLREEDADTAISQNCIRTKVLSGEIPCVRVGSKRLINYDQMLDQLQNPPMQASVQPEYGAIRRVGA